MKFSNRFRGMALALCIITPAVAGEFSIELQRVPGSAFGGSLFEAGDKGAFDDEWVTCPSVLRVGDEYWMWYSSFYGREAGRGGVGLAISDDGKAWKRANDGKPVLALGPTRSLDAGQIVGPCVLRENGTFRMWYTGQDDSGGVKGIQPYRIFLAESSDGVHWKRSNNGKPVLDLGPEGSADSVQAATPVVFTLDDGSYRMWYAAWGQGHGHTICTARSADGVTWTKERNGKPVKGLAAEAYGHGICKVGDHYVMLFQRLKATRGLYAASSTDGEQWTMLNNGEAVLLPSESKDTFDNYHVAHPDMLVEDGILRVWYAGYRDRKPTMRILIGLAEWPLGKNKPATTHGARKPRIDAKRTNVTQATPAAKAQALQIDERFEIISPKMIDKQGVVSESPGAFSSGTPLRLPDGRLMMIFGTAGKKFSDNTGLHSAVSTDGGRTWGDVQSIEQNPEPVSHGRPTALVARDGTIHVFYYGWVTYTKDPATSQSDMWTVRSNDGGKTWGHRQKIWKGYTGMTEGCIQLSTGRILLPLGALQEPTRFAGAVVRSDDGGDTWATTDGIELPSELDAAVRGRLTGGAIEPTVAELSDGRVLLYARTITGHLYQSISSDRGVTWPKLERSDLTCGGTAMVSSISGSKLVLLWNQANPASIARMKYPHGFDAQSIAVSTDDGKTWSKPIEYAKAERTVHSLTVETEPGQLLITMPGHGLLLRAKVADIEANR